jgi:protein Mpv17
MKQARRDSMGPTGNDAHKDDFFNVEIHELEAKVPWPNEPDLLSPKAQKMLPPPFDFERMVRFMAYPCIMAPVQLRWFAFLNKTFPIGIAGASNTFAALKRVAFDQFIFAPVGELRTPELGLYNKILTFIWVWDAFSHS